LFWDPDLSPELAQLLALFGSESLALTGVGLVLPDPPPQGLVGYTQFLGNLGD